MISKLYGNIKVCNKRKLSCGNFIPSRPYIVTEQKEKGKLAIKSIRRNKRVFHRTCLRNLLLRKYTK